MSRLVTKDSTSVSIVIKIIDDTDGTPETSVVFDSSGIDLKYRREGATVVSITEADLTTPALDDAWAEGGFLAIGNGYYRIDVPDAAFATGVNGVLIFGTVTGMVVIGEYVQLTDVNINDGADGGMTTLTSLLTGTPTTKYMGPFGPGVYVDSGAGNTDTDTGTDGIVSNPVSTFAAARTIADAIGVTTYYVVGNSDITLAATHEDWSFVGLGEVTSNVVNLGSQDVDRSSFYNLTIEGTQGGTGRLFASECALQDPGAGATTLHIFASRCGIMDEIEVDTSADNVFENCYSLVAGTAAPIIVATGASGTISIRHYSGGIELSTLSASHNVSVETDGQVIFTADCNVNATVALRGNMTIIDNTAGMNNLTTDAVYDKRADIAAILVDTGTTIPGLLNPTLLISDTIQSAISDKEFTLSSGASTDDDAYNGQVVVITDQTNSWQKYVGSVEDYTGSSRTVDMVSPSVFNLAAGDIVEIFALRIGVETIDPGAFTNAKFAAGALTPTEASVNISEIGGVAASATQLSASAATMLIGTVDTATNGHTPTTTEFQADDITEATADHFNGRIVIFTSGVLQNQATDITDYVAVGGIGQFTVTAMTEAPSNNDTFVIV